MGCVKEANVAVPTKKLGDSLVAEFEVNEGCSVIRIENDCGCTSATYDRKRRAIRMSYAMKSFPRHLRDKESLDVMKGATVFYRQDGSPIVKQERIQFKVTYEK